MDFIAEDYEALPILLAQALAKDPEDWTIILKDSEGNVIAEGYVLTETDWDNCVLGQDPTETGNALVFDKTVTVSWDDVGAVVA